MKKNSKRSNFSLYKNYIFLGSDFGCSINLEGSSFKTPRLTSVTSNPGRCCLERSREIISFEHNIFDEMFDDYYYE